jgi:hypothetical protein
MSLLEPLAISEPMLGYDAAMEDGQFRYSMLFGRTARAFRLVTKAQRHGCHSYQTVLGTTDEDVIT